MQRMVLTVQIDLPWCLAVRLFSVFAGEKYASPVSYPGLFALSEWPEANFPDKLDRWRHIRNRRGRLGTRLMRASTIFSTIAGKIQNMSNVRSEACAVDWFSFIRGIHSCAMTSRKTHVDEITSKFPQHADYNRGFGWGFGTTPNQSIFGLLRC